MNKLYHKEVFWNNRFDKEAMNLVYMAYRLSFHLKEHLNNPDRKHLYNESDIWGCLERIKNDEGYLFEVETSNGKVCKSVYRVKYNDNTDMCIVIRPEMIVTAWVNKHDDKHSTLDTAKYVRG